MYSKVKIAGHPVHPMLVAFPVALYTATAVLLIVYQVTGDFYWLRTGVLTNAAGVIAAAVAAVPGFIDFIMGIPRGTRASATARNHALLNVTALVLFVVNLFVIRHGWSGPIENSGIGVLLSLLGVGATLGAGWFGWKLVQTHHVGVEPLSQRDFDEATRAARLDIDTRHVAPPGAHPQAH
jgi:uncharacterized membrane protein